MEVQLALNKTQAVGLFFAAPWSGPCHGWASVLEAFKTEVNADFSNFLEIVLIPMNCGIKSGDQLEEEQVMQALDDSYQELLL